MARRGGVEGRDHKGAQENLRVMDIFINLVVVTFSCILHLSKCIESYTLNICCMSVIPQ